MFHYGKHKQIGGNLSQRTLAHLAHYLLMFCTEDRSLIILLIFRSTKNFYDFFSSGIVDGFLESVYKIYRPLKENKIQGMLKLSISKEMKSF